VFAKVSVEELTPAEVDATYRRRQDHENSFAELDHHLAGKCLPKPYRLLREANEKGQKRKTMGTTLSAETMTGLRFVAWLRHWTYNLVKDFGAALGGRYATMEVGTLVRKFIARPGILRLRGNQFLVILMPFTGCAALTEWVRQINEQQFAIPWLGHLILQIEIASHPVGCAADLQAVQRRIFANSHSHFPA
jgi:hypothetical protein